MPRVLPATPEHIALAAAALHAGALVAFPTETVYGLGGATLEPAAIARIYGLKGRPRDNPLIAHVLTIEDARRLIQPWEPRMQQLAEAFWPGPLTIVGSRAEGVPLEATGGRQTIAVRSPAHPVARALLEAFGQPISAPSANRSGHVSPTTAKHVEEDFAAHPELIILDAGAAPVGIESTVIDLSDRSAQPVLLRPGSISQEAIEAVIGPVDAPMIDTQQAGPGTSRSHYAPRTPAELLTHKELLQRITTNPADELWVVLALHEDVQVSPPHRRIMMPSNARAYAARLYSALREADACRGTRILIEHPSPTSNSSAPSTHMAEGGASDQGDHDLWRSILDRLHRATA